MTRADVTASDGKSYAAVTHFQSADTSAVAMIDESTRTFAVEGPLGWAADGDRSSLGSNHFKVFALGHQYHAMLLYFDDIVIEPYPSDSIPYGGESRTGVSGAYPYGGTVHLVYGLDEFRPAGIVLELPDAEPITATFSDWREIEEQLLPYSVDIDDGERRFEYRYTDIDLGPASAGWFQAAVEAPGEDKLQLYRLHRRLLVAHCEGDAELMARLSTPEIVVANAGELMTITNAEMLEQFQGVFAQLDYVAYTDLAAPVIEAAESGDVAWIAVSTRAEGEVVSNGQRFDNQWAWVMMARKVDGKWLHAGSASNVKR
jgi:ketosteroid isomerase-like protein